FPWGRYRSGQPEVLAGSFSRVFTVEHGFNEPDDIVLRRNEAVSDLHLEAAISGSIDLFRDVRAWVKNALRRLRSAGEVANAPSEQRDDSRPLIALVLPSLGIGGGAEAANATLARELVRSGFRVEFVVGRHDEPRCVLADSAGYVLLNASKTRRLLRPLARYLKRRQ